MKDVMYFGPHRITVEDYEFPPGTKRSCEGALCIEARRRATVTEDEFVALTAMGYELVDLSPPAPPPPPKPAKKPRAKRSGKTSAKRRQAQS